MKKQDQIVLRELQKEFVRLLKLENKLERKLERSRANADQTGHYSHEYAGDLTYIESKIKEIQTQINLVAEGI